MLNTLLIKSVLHAQVVEQQKDPNLLNAPIALEEVRSELIKDFLQFSKLVLNVVVTEKQ